MWSTGAAALSTLATGTLAGALTGTGIAAYASRALPEGAWVRRFQLEGWLFSRLLPPFLWGTLLCLAAACALHPGAGETNLVAATLCVLLATSITVGYEVPIRREVQSWTAWVAPGHWAEVRDRWLWMHLVRCLFAAAAFACAVFALV